MTTASLAPQTETLPDLAMIPVERSVIFSNHKDVPKPRVEKRQRKLLAKIAPALKPFLQENERVWLVTTACSPFTLIEQLTTGWVIAYVKRALLVFTDRRLLHVPTRANYAYRHSIAQVRWADCADVKRRGHRLVLTYRSGEKETFSYLGSPERKKVTSILGRTRTAPVPGEASAGRVHLCPRCTSTLVSGKYTCPYCHLEFKDYDEARRRSILIPGGGYFYTGHRWLGLGDALTEGALLVIVAAALWELSQGAETALPEVALLGAMLFLEKLVTVYHSSHFVKEFLPKESEITVRGR